MTATPRDWSDPLLEQAREDLRAAWSVDSGHCASTLCMLLQMVYEKIAKAARARNGEAITKTHKAASHLLNLLRRHRSKVPQATPSVLSFIQQLEDAQPAIAQGLYPQLEYPWTHPTTGRICSPATDLPLAKRVRDPRDRIAVDTLKLASALIKDFDVICP
jgi:hypothetical protein